MGIFNSIISALPPIQIQGANIPPWLELVGAIVVIIILILSMLPKLGQGYGRLKAQGVGTPNDWSDEMPGGDYR